MQIGAGGSDTCTKFRLILAMYPAPHLSHPSRLHTIGGTDGTSPSRLRVFTNRDDLDFGTAADTTPVQEWDLLENPRGEIEYPTQYVMLGLLGLLLGGVFLECSRECKGAVSQHMHAHAHC